jgi:hypothetical protein
MQSIIKKLNILANITIIIVGMIMVSLLVKRQFFRETKVAPNKVQIGTRFPLQGVKWDQSDQTLLLAIAEKCHFCTESAPFYRKLAEIWHSQNRTKTIVITPDEINEGERYVNSLGISVDEVKQARHKSLGITGTPTVVLVNGSGIVTGVWRGKLTSVQEMEILDRLKGVSPGQTIPVNGAIADHNDSIQKYK